MTVLTFSNDMAPVPESPSPKAAAQPLLDLPKHTIAPAAPPLANPAFGLQDNLVSRRLHHLGFLPNTAIKIVAKGLFGRPPFAIQLAGGAQFSLRRDELAKIKCRMV